MKVYKKDVRYWFEDSFGFFYGDLLKKQLQDQIDFDVCVCMDYNIKPTYKWDVFSICITYEDGTEEFIQF